MSEYTGRMGQKRGPEISKDELLSLSDSFKTIKRLTQYLTKQKYRLIFVMIVLLLRTGVSMINPLLTKTAIDNYIANKDVAGLVNTGIELICIYFASSFLSWLDNFMMIDVSQNTLRQIRKDCFVKMEKLNVSFFDKNKVGDLMSRLSNDVDVISNTLTTTVIQILTSIVTLVSAGVLMFYINPILAAITIVTVPLLVFSIRRLTAISRRQFRKSRVQLGEMNSFIQEHVNGIKTTQAFNQEDRVIKEFNIENDKYNDILIKSSISGGFIRPVINFLNTLRYVILVTAGAILTLHGKATVGTIVSFNTLSNQFSNPINQLASLYNSIQQSLVSAERVFEVIDSDEIIYDTESAKAIDKVDGYIDFNHVCFSYQKEKQVLKDISFSIKPGMKVALVGPTGAGKTSIINLLNRFYEADTGEILIDHRNIKEFKRDSLRSRIGMVLQDTYLFTDTIYNNLKYGNAKLSDQEIVEACEMTNCHDFIMKLPQQYNTVLSREGSNISQGERQLLSLTRTLLARCDILILDEATASVDTITEKQIQSAIEILSSSRTTFMIAHRLSTIRKCDLILVINDGRILEQGTHEELLKQQGLYYDLHNAIDINKLKEFEIIS